MGRDQDNETKGDVSVITKQLVGHVDNSSHPQITVNIQLTLTTPANAARPAPVIIEFTFNFGPPRPGVRIPVMPAQTGPTWQEQVPAKDWGYATLIPPPHSSRQRRGIDARRHRSGQQGPAAQDGRLGRAACLGLGRQPCSELLLRPPSRSMPSACRDRGPLALQ
jgi:hypothetical protein